MRYINRNCQNLSIDCSLTVSRNANISPFDYVYKYFYKDKTREEQIVVERFLLKEKQKRQKLYEEAKKIQNEMVNELKNTSLSNGEKLTDYITVEHWWRAVEIPVMPSFIFNYTSPAGRSHNQAVIPVSGELWNFIQEKERNRTSAQAQRNLMTKKLRDEILQRDNFTCKQCGNSIYREPNLLLEVDHIIPVSRGGKTVKENLQTLCWKCNRSKGDRMN